MSAKITLKIKDDCYDAFKDLMDTTFQSLTHQIAALDGGLANTLDPVIHARVTEYIGKCILQLAVVKHILEELPERPKIVCPNGNT